MKKTALVTSQTSQALKGCLGNSFREAQPENLTIGFKKDSLKNQKVL